jgi:hypothetical protein
MMVLPNENIGFLLDIQSWGEVPYSHSLQCAIVIEEMFKDTISLYFTHIMSYVVREIVYVNVHQSC